MWTYPHIDPVALDLGFAKIHWYGLMYILGIGAAWYLSHRKALARPGFLTTEQISDLAFYASLGVVLGGRIGYILFYDLAQYLEQPLNMFKVWQGGMSFHGGLLGVMLATYLYARKHGLHFFATIEFFAPFVPIGLGAGRWGNFVNGELWGKVAPSDSWLAMQVYDPQLQMTIAKYPTQLMEMLLEGLVLFIILFILSQKPRPLGFIAGTFGVFYGAFRFVVEFFRMPDAQLGYLAWDWLTMGQVLSLPMIVIGAGLILWSRNQAKLY